MHLAPIIHPTQSVLPDLQILKRIKTSGPVSLPNSTIFMAMTTEPSRGTLAPPATPLRASLCSHFSSFLIGCRLSERFIPAFLFSSSKPITSSSVVELTPEPPSIMTECSDIPTNTSVKNWMPESSRGPRVQTCLGRSSRLFNGPSPFPLLDLSLTFSKRCLPVLCSPTDSSAG